MKTAFVLSGGGNLGAMQAGTLLALCEAGIEPDLVVGTSVGALNSAFLACHPGVDGARALRDAWTGLRREDAVQLNAAATFMGIFGFRNHLVSTKRLRALIEKWIPILRFQDSKIALGAVATDALSGEAVLLTKGDVRLALIASAAIPGIFPPVRLEDRWLIDGSLSSNHPVLEAQELGANEIYLITTATQPRVAPPKGAIAVAMNSVSLLTTRVASLQLAEAQPRAAQNSGHIHVVPSAEPLAPGPFDYRKGDTLAWESYQRARRWLSEEYSLATDTPRDGRRDQQEISRHRSDSPRIRAQRGAPGEW